MRQKVDNKTKAIIFCGGGLIKYNHQFLSEPVEAVIEYAEKINIPVMMSAVGVEGYDMHNNECITLKQALNLPCVKYITTRDDINLLQSSWVENKIKTGLVLDPACYSNQIIPPNEKQTGVIGLGIGREGLFADYDVNVSDESISTLWKNLYNRLTKLGFECRFFTNGLPEDQEFAEKIVDELHLDKYHALISRPTTTKELCDTISSMSGIIATRLHSCIISYSYSVPFVGLVWNQKQKLFGHCIDREWAFIDSDLFTADYIVECLQKSMEMETIASLPEKNNTKYWIEQFLDECVY